METRISALGQLLCCESGGRPWNRTRRESPRRSYSPLPHLAARRPLSRSDLLSPKSFPFVCGVDTFGRGGRQQENDLSLEIACAKKGQPFNPGQ